MGLFENIPYTNFHNLNLDWIINTIKEAIDKLDENSAAITELNELLDSLEIRIDSLEEFEQDFLNGEFVEVYIQQLTTWINNNMIELISDAMKNVWFGLTENGFYVAYQPESWDDIIFDTGADTTNLDEYNHLILKY